MTVTLANATAKWALPRQRITPQRADAARMSICISVPVAAMQRFPYASPMPLSTPQTRSMRPPSAGARVRGRYMQIYAAEIDALPEPERTQVRDAVDADTWWAIANCPVFGWLPFDFDVELTRAVNHALGPRRAHEFHRDTLLRAFESPLLKSLVDSVIRIFGLDVGTFLNWISKGFDLMFQDAGEWKVVDRTATAATIRVVGLPRSAVEDHVWLESLASAASALFTLANVEGAAILRDVDVHTGAASIRLRWQEK